MEEKNNNTNKNVIDLVEVGKSLWKKKKYFFIVWPIVFALSCLWIFPQPRFYTCNVTLAPEGTEQSGSGLAGIASSFGINLGDMQTTDAIYPTLYPDLFESPQFLVGLFTIKVKTSDGKINTDYYTYRKKYKKKNWLTKPFDTLRGNINKKLFPEDYPASGKNISPDKINSFNMSKRDYNLMEEIKEDITCDIDKKTDVITISVKDQDKLVCALLADSIKERLQNFIIEYRTKKVRQDEKYYKHLTDSARISYEKALAAYGAYQDSHRLVVEQAYVEQGEKVKNDLDTKLQTYNTFNTQYQATKAKVQERTPSFTTLKSATVPQKPAGPKRMIFVIAMLLLSTIVTAFWLVRKELLGNK